ncbi:MAG: thiol:disulfide interchange protein [Cyanothece sp. SIO1E1]|nr:thiol:disulfide interchange protein [Cyanothece sp. SIO1E1]
MLKQIVTWLIAMIISLLAAFLPLAPAGANPVQTENVQVQLISEVEAIQPGTPFWVALQFEIRPGWHLYWRNPGDSGAKPTINWTLPPGFEVGDIVWPHPERLPAGPLLNFGYEDEVLLLSQVTPPESASSTGSMQLKADADWLVCEIDCIPEQAVLDLTLPIAADAPSVDSRWITAFERTRQALPQTPPWPITATLTDIDLMLQVEAPELASAPIEQVSFFPNQDGVIVNAAAQTFNLVDQGLTLQVQRGYLAELEQVSGVLVIREQLESGTIDQAFTVDVAIAPTITSTSPASTPLATPEPQLMATLPLWQIFSLALLGGVTLNLMPCVFPVLSLKALNIAQKAQKSTQQVRWQALAFTGGILVSFAIVASSLLVLRALGQQIGWGFQLQSPPFVMLMAYLLFGVGLNLSGVFVFGTAFMGLGQRLTDRAGYLGEFFTGVFATVVATPCTAPFMATAIGVALTQPAPVAIAIFEVLGVGLALPYVLISLMPGLQQRLPKPGAWMETLQQLLAFPMYAAAAWLVWVLTQQAGTTGLAAVLAGFISLSFAAWLYQKTQLSSRIWQRTGAIATLAVLAFALTLTQVPNAPSSPTSAANQTAKPNAPTETNWEPYSVERLTELRQMGKPVFVNFTANWCITCLVNDRIALSQPEVISAFKAKGITYLKGDWTNRDRTITAALESFGRSGVPLYVLYPGEPETAEPIVLPQILSVAQVTNAIDDL